MDIWLHRDSSKDRSTSPTRFRGLFGHFFSVNWRFEINFMIFQPPLCLRSKLTSVSSKINEDNIAMYRDSASELYLCMHGKWQQGQLSYSYTSPKAWASSLQYLKWANNTQLRINFFGIGRLNVARVHSFRWVDIIFFLTNYKLASTITWENILILFNYSHSLYALLYLYLCEQTLNFVVFPCSALLWVNTRDLMAVAPLKLFTQLRFLHLMALIIWQRRGRRWASFRPFDQQAMLFEFSRSLLLCLFSSFAVLLLSSSSPRLAEQLNYCYYPFSRSVDSREQASRWILSFIPSHADSFFIVFCAIPVLQPLCNRKYCQFVLSVYVRSCECCQSSPPWALLRSTSTWILIMKSTQVEGLGVAYFECGENRRWSES